MVERSVWRCARGVKMTVSPHTRHPALRTTVVIALAAGASALVLHGCGGSNEEAGRHPVSVTTAPVPVTPTAPAVSSTTMERTLPGPPFAVGMLRTTFIDPTRPTPARGPTPASERRELPTTIRYPVPGVPQPVETSSAASLPGSFPVVVFAHGFALADFTYPRFLHDLASEGFVVADPELPLSSAALPGPAMQGDEVEQARDLSFVVDRLLDPATRPTPLAGLTLTAPVAVAGHSDGGITAIGLAANACCADARVGAAVILSGALGHFPGSWFTATSPPILLVHGDADEVNPLASSATIYDVARSPKLFVVVHGGSHIGAFEDDARRPAVAHLIGEFLRAYLLHDTDAQARLTQDATVPNVLDLRAAN
jgi:alpha-beta hydrolase superfamily lysophospholipase